MIKKELLQKYLNNEKKDYHQMSQDLKAHQQLFNNSVKLADATNRWNNKLRERSSIIERKLETMEGLLEVKKLTIDYLELYLEQNFTDKKLN